MTYLLHLVVYLSAYAVIALSLNLVVGYCGMLTLAHAGYVAIGGYAYAVLASVAGWGFIPATAIGALLAAVLSLAVSLPSWRLRGDFFVLASLAVQALIFSVLQNWANPQAPLGSWQNLTNGPYGIVGIPDPSILGWRATTPTSIAILALVVATMSGVVLWRLYTSPWARLLEAIRDDELAARAVGKNSRIVKVQAFAISAAFASVGGALYAAQVGYLDPSSASLGESVLMLTMVIIGGLGNFKGPLLGAAIVVLVPEALRFLRLPEGQAANVRVLIFGSLLVLAIHLRPQGIAGKYRVR